MKILKIAGAPISWGVCEVPGWGHRLTPQRVLAEMLYTEAVQDGLYTPLGGGDTDISGIVTVLRGIGFDGWSVMEQHTVLDGEPTDEGPVRDMRSSVAYLRSICQSAVPAPAPA